MVVVPEGGGVKGGAPVGLEQPAAFPRPNLIREGGGRRAREGRACAVLRQSCLTSAHDVTFKMEIAGARRHILHAREFRAESMRDTSPPSRRPMYGKVAAGGLSSGCCSSL
eukprot:360210-Chlamydomonas_euryale.AAC.12